jgi:uncharacterized NAD(P)/FAD-binding protein YdhS
LTSTRSKNLCQKTAERELAAIRSHEEHVHGMERDREALLDSLAAAAPKALDSLTPEERYRWYKMLRLFWLLHLRTALFFRV